MIKHGETLIVGWNSEVSRDISNLYQAPIWPYLSQKHPNIGNVVAELDRGIARFCQLLNMMKECSEISEKLFQNFIALIIQIGNSTSKLRTKLNGFFVNPVKCLANRHSDILPTTEGGGVLRYVKEIDQFVPNVFCDLKELDFVCEQILENCQKHKKLEGGGSTVWFKIYKEDPFVCLEFIDDIEGDFQLNSKGGLKIVREFCEQYGCCLDINNPSDNESKSIKISLISITN